MSSPTLITLPNEMIARVVDHLGVEDCQQLRLTNKLLSVFASKELARLCFKTVNVSMTRYTLDALVRVCQHPIFGQYVREVGLLTTHARPERITKPLKNFQNSFKTGGLEDLNNAYHVLQVYAKQCHEEFTLEQSGEGTQLLTTALKSLKERGQSVLLSATDCPISMEIGAKRAYRDRAFKHISHCNGRLRSSMRALANAAFRSGCRINGLHIKHDCDISDCELDSPECVIDLGHVLGAFSMIKTLCIDFTDLPSEKSLKSLGAMLSISRQLEDVTVSLRCVPGTYRLEKASIRTVDDLLCEGLSHGLKKVRLSGFPISQYGLVCILGNSFHTLQSLELTQIALRRGTWDLVIPWLRNNFSLSEITIEDVYQVDDDDLNGEGYLAEEVDFESICATGREEVNSALADCI
ncbi:hypothetical protein D6C91_05463 [Aureobasidium pullulans]|uniref:F-box domain-containing protein n=1 Tax=Aureobasidium pullulans TaxID=5580 RepID=A0A4S9T3C6_AURPU|nr:hypothetical protein D6C91_05463 [Aureobasidium pullulans]